MILNEIVSHINLKKMGVFSKRDSSNLNMINFLSYKVKNL